MLDRFSFLHEAEQKYCAAQHIIIEEAPGNGAHSRPLDLVPAFGFKDLVKFSTRNLSFPSASFGHVTATLRRINRYIEIE